MSHILVLCGAKQSGKSSLANFLYGFYLTRAKIVDKFTIDNDGKLIVPATVVNEEGQEVNGDGILELQTPSDDVALWASENVWPLVKDYAFANMLKMCCINLFDLTYEQCFGTNEQKNSLSKIKWENMADLLSTKERMSLKKAGLLDKNMTAREVLQYFGTNICRTIYDTIWIDRVFTQIQQDNPKIAIITDCRYKNEVLAAKANGAKIVKLTKRDFEDSHTSENDLNDLPDTEYDLIIDNQNMSIKEKNMAMYEGLKNWNIINVESL